MGSSPLKAHGILLSALGPGERDKARTGGAQKKAWWPSSDQFPLPPFSLLK